MSIFDLVQGILQLFLLQLINKRDRHVISDEYVFEPDRNIYSDLLTLKMEIYPQNKIDMEILSL